MRLLAMEIPSCPLKVCSNFHLAHWAYGRLKKYRGQYTELFDLVSDWEFYGFPLRFHQRLPPSQERLRSSSEG